ncbi:TonB-dependent receptor [soil metagenome]
MKAKHLIFFITVILFLSSSGALAQRDTSKRQSIDVISAYKPVLRNAVKINLAPGVLETDTTKPKLIYDIPALNLFFAYQPVPLQPRTLTVDTGLQLGQRRFIKVGYGNFSTPYLNTGLSFGDGKAVLFNLYADYISSKGSIPSRDFNNFNIKAAGSYFTAANEFYGGLGYHGRQYYQYGYDTLAFHYSKDSVSRSYRDFAIRAGFRNKVVNDLKINYDPNIEAHIFSRENAVTENNLIITLPAELRVGESVSVKASVLADLTNNSRQTSSGNFKTVNNLFQIAPELVYYSDKFTFHGGALPTWDNGVLSVLPNIYGQAQLQHNILFLQAGWVGRFIKNNFRTLSSVNPYMQDPIFLLNTKEVQYYAGIKASLSKPLNFNTKVAFITYSNMPLFVNDTLTTKGFFISNESKMNDLQIHGDVSYISQDKFTLSAAVDVNTYSSLAYNNNAWHLIPLHFTGSIRWNAFRQVLIKGDLFYFSDIPALEKNKKEITLPSAADISAGAEFKINKSFSAWLDFNNILNRKYERWNRYPVYGLQLIGGLIYNF